MTTPAHAALSGSAVFAVTGNLYATAAAAVAGTLPDFLAWLLPILTGEDRWSYYERMHSRWWWLLPPAGLHVEMDALVHLPEGGMKLPDYYVWEVATWLMSAYLVCLRLLS